MRLRMISSLSGLVILSSLRAFTFRASWLDRRRCGRGALCPQVSLALHMRLMMISSLSGLVTLSSLRAFTFRASWPDRRRCGRGLSLSASFACAPHAVNDDFVPVGTRYPFSPSRFLPFALHGLTVGVREDSLSPQVSLAPDMRLMMISSLSGLVTLSSLRAFTFRAS